MKTILQLAYFVYVVLTFVIGSVIFFPIITIASLFKNIKSRKLVFKLIRIWLKMWLFIIGMNVTRKGNAPHEKCIMIANHISYMDTLVLFPATNNYFRMLGNKEMSRLPILSIVYKQIAILVDRSSQRSRMKSFRLMMSMVKRGTSVFIFPEGKFNTGEEIMKDFYDGAFKLAINTQTPIYPIVLPDTVNRWHYSVIWKLSPGKNRVIFLDKVDVKGMTLDNLEELKKSVHNLMCNELKKYR